MRAMIHQFCSLRVVAGDMNGVLVEECQGTIPDAFRTAHFEPTTEFPLPDSRASQADFDAFIDAIRDAGGEGFASLLAGAQL